nr:DUF6194 family protein [uncultured Oscillibacter sp.]
MDSGLSLLLFSKFGLIIGWPRYRPASEQHRHPSSVPTHGRRHPACVAYILLLPRGMYLVCIDQILPHPVYAWMGWICALNPSEETFGTLRPYMREAYEYAKDQYEKKRI